MIEFLKDLFNIRSTLYSFTSQFGLLHKLPQLVSLNISDRGINDLLCSMVGHELDASYVSILAFNSEDNELKNIGSFLNPKLLNNTNLNGNILSLIEMYYLSPRYEKGDNKKSYEFYTKHSLLNRTCSIEQYNAIKDQLESDKQKLQVFLNKITFNDTYPMDTEENLSSLYFKSLIEEETPEKVLIKSIRGYDNLSCQKNLSKNFNDNFNSQYFDKYIALALEDNGRHYGLLRIILPKKEFYKSKLNKKTESLFFSSLQQTISYVLESKFYSVLHHKISRFNSVTNLTTENKTTFFNNQATEIVKILNLRGCLIRQQTKDEGYKIIGKSNSIQDYPMDSILENEVLYHFKENTSCNTILFDIPKTPNANSVVCQNFYTKDDERKETNELKIDFSKSKSFISYCNQNNLSQALILNTDAEQKTFIILFNSKWRNFISRDIELMQFVCNEIRTEINSNLRNERLSNRREAIIAYHLDLDLLTNEVLTTDEYISKFYAITNSFISDVSFITKHQIFDYIKQIGPVASKKLIFKSFNEFSKSLIEIDLNEETSKYFISDGLVSEFRSYIPSETKNVKIDIPVHSKDGLVMAICVEFEKVLYDSFETELNRFFSFLQQQLQLGWLKLEEHILFRLQQKIDDINNVLISEEILGDRITLSVLGHRLANLLSLEFNSPLVTLFKADKRNKLLDLIASNHIDVQNQITYNLSDASLSTVSSYNQKIDFRLFGNETIESNTNKEKLQHLISLYSSKITDTSFDSNEKIDLCEWLSVNINYSELSNKNLGLIKLFRFKSTNTDESCNSYSEFHFNIIKQIKKYVFTLYNDIDFHINELDNRLVDLRIVTHQVLTPASAIHRTLQIIPRLPERLHQKHYDFISSQAGLLKSYTRNYERFLDINSNEYEVELKDLNISERLVEIAKYFQPLTREKGITVHVEKQSNDVKLCVDKFLVDHVIFNMIDNACKYSFFKNERVKNNYPSNYYSDYDNLINVIIEIEHLDKLLRVRIKNLGYEIYEKERNKIFDLNYRGEEAKDKEATGSGIGLFVAKKIVEHNSGIISHNYGRNRNNNIFTIEIPYK